MVKDTEYKIRLSKQERELFKKEAEARGLNLASFIRYSLMKEIGGKR